MKLVDKSARMPGPTKHELYLEGLKSDGLPIPVPSSHVEYVDIPA